MPAKTPLLIFSAGGNATEALDCLGERFALIGFIDDAPEKQGRRLQGFEIFDRSALERFPEAQVLACVGSPQHFAQRAAIIQSLGLPERRFAQVWHTSAQVSAYAQIGYNTLLMPGVVVSAQAQIGNHVIVLANTVLHHDSRLEDYVCVGAQVVVAGHVQIGEGAYIGSGATLLQGIGIGQRALVGMGSNVLKSVAAGARVAGNPAVEIKKKGLH